MDESRERAAKIAKEQQRIAEMQTVGGDLVLFCPDGCDGPYTVLGIYAGPGTGWHYIAEYADYVSALTAMVERIKGDIARG